MRCHFTSLWRYCRLPRHFYIWTMSCIAFGCNNTAFAAQLKLSDAAHAHLTAECRDMHIITECYVSVTSRIWCAIRASSNLFCTLSIIILFTTEWSIASIKKSKLALECTQHGVYSVCCQLNSKAHTVSLSLTDPLNLSVVQTSVCTYFSPSPESSAHHYNEGDTTRDDDRRHRRDTTLLWKTRWRHIYVVGES